MMEDVKQRVSINPLPIQHVVYQELTATKQSIPTTPKKEAPSVLVPILKMKTKKCPLITFFTCPENHNIVKYGIMPYLMSNILKDNGIDRFCNINTFRLSMVSS